MKVQKGKFYRRNTSKINVAAVVSDVVYRDCV